MTNILFVCVHNSGRSQMAEALTNKLAEERGMPVRALSAGTAAGQEVNPAAIEVMHGIGVSMAGMRPKQLTEDMADGADRMITMGCGASSACPARIFIMEDWGIDDPEGESIARVRAIRDQIVSRVDALLAELGGDA